MKVTRNLIGNPLLYLHILNFKNLKKFDLYVRLFICSRALACSSKWISSLLNSWKLVIYAFIQYLPTFTDVIMLRES